MDRRFTSTAVVVDEWPLVRLGISQALRSIEIDVVADTPTGEDAVRLVDTKRCRYLLLGLFRDLGLPEAARRAKALVSPPKVLVLVDRMSRDELEALLPIGIDALLPRSVSPAELASTISRVAEGERVVAPALLPLLVGVLGPTAGDAEDAGTEGPDSLTRKELEVLARLAEGRSNREIAEALFITPATVKSHLAHIYVKLGVAGRQEAMAKAMALGLLR